MLIVKLYKGDLLDITTCQTFKVKYQHQAALIVAENKNQMPDVFSLRTIGYIPEDNEEPFYTACYVENISGKTVFKWDNNTEPPHC